MSGSVAAPIVAVGAIALHEDQLLFVRRGRGPAAGWWSVPGGRVEQGETLYEAVVREVHEETGLAVAVDHFVGIAEQLPAGDPGDEHFVILDYLVTVLDPALTPVAGDDAAEVAWVPLHELSEYRVVPGLVDFLADHGILDP